jgi:exodeoxyribonuclease VII small subunit
MSQPVDTLSFEEALAELEKIVRQLESGAGDLKASIAAYERGVALRQHCEARLKEAESRIEKITLGADGQPGAVPFAAGEG